MAKHIKKKWTNNATEEQQFSESDSDSSEESVDNTSMDCENHSSVGLDNNPSVDSQRGILKRSRAVSCYSKEDLLRICRNAFTFNRFNTMATLMVTICMDQRIPHIFVEKAALILSTQQPIDMHRLKKTMNTIMTYNVNKKAIILEVLLAFITNKDIDGAKDYIWIKDEFIKSDLIRKNRVIDTYLQCYIAYISYLRWKESLNYSENRLIADKSKLSLRNIIKETKGLNLDMFVIILVELYEKNEELRDAFDILEVYVANNPNHINSYIYLHNFLVKYPILSNDKLKFKTLKKIREFSADNSLVLYICEDTGEELKDKFITNMEFISHKQNFNDMKGWTQLKDLITSIKDEEKNTVKKIWKEVYESYWTRLHFNVKTIKEINENVIHLIECKQIVLKFFYSSSHNYISETNEMIAIYRRDMN